MVSTFQAFAVFLIALLPGALYTFAYERRAGSFGITASDRVIRFLAASAILQALLAGPAYVLYRRLVLTGDLRSGRVSFFVVELTGIVYVVLPMLVGTLIGMGQTTKGRRWGWTRLFATEAPEPRAWDHLWRRKPDAIIRMRLKSGRWIAGAFGTIGGKKSYASAYPEPCDLFLSVGFQVDPRTGEFMLDTDDKPKRLSGNSGLLIRWDEVEYFEVLEA